MPRRQRDTHIADLQLGAFQTEFLQCFLGLDRCPRFADDEPRLLDTALVFDLGKISIK